MLTGLEISCTVGFPPYGKEIGCIRKINKNLFINLKSSFMLRVKCDKKNKTEK